jgi:hypothetical protein
MGLAELAWHPAARARQTMLQAQRRGNSGRELERARHDELVVEQELRHAAERVVRRDDDARMKQA